MEYTKHRFNIYPEMQPEEFERLRGNLLANGYDAKNPIWLFEGAIIDGWNRYRACDALGITPVVRNFEGSEIDAMQFAIRTNDRRDLSSSQRAAIAVEAEELVGVLKAEAKTRQIESGGDKKSEEFKESVPQLIAEPIKPEHREVRTQLAQTFGTNRQYVSDAAKIKAENPDAFEAIKAGVKTITEFKSEVKHKALQEAQRQKILSLEAEAKIAPIISLSDCKDFLKTIKPESIDLILTDPPYITEFEPVEFRRFVDSWLNDLLSKLKQTGRAFICTGAYPQEILTYLLCFQKSGFILDAPLIWTYRNTLGQTPKMKYNLNYQLIWHLYKTTSNPLDTSITNEMFSVQDINAPDGRLGDRFHTWQKPDELANRLVRHASKEGETVLDVFACTGTFLIAAAKAKRHAIGCEINEVNIEIAKNRGCKIG
jgi:site-specific DNA-methyltransferase (adenine-specific)